MRALTVHPAWAWSIIHAKRKRKDVVNCNWDTQIRGTFAVHSSKEVVEDSGFPAGASKPRYEDLVTGAIIGVVDLVRVVDDSPSPWFEGPNGFLLENPRPLKKPIPHAGRGGFWSVDEKVIKRIIRQVGKIESKHPRRWGYLPANKRIPIDPRSVAEKPSKEQILAAYEYGVIAYIDKRKKKLPKFVKQQFGFKGALKRNRKALGLDVLKAPANVIWSVVVLLTKLSGKGAGLVGLKQVERKLDKIWPGFTTAVQRESERLIYEELLELPWREDQEESPRNALLEEILNQPEISPWIDSAMEEIATMSDSKEYQKKLAKNLQVFATAQVSAADLASNLLILAGAYVTKKEVATGAVGAGSILATVLANHIAVQSFLLGPTLGGIWYGWFPASAGLGLTAVSIASATLLLSVLVAFAGVITDPVQNLLGLNEKRLDATLDELEEDLLGGGSKGVSTKSPLVARVFDVVDLISRGKDLVPGV